MKELIQIELDNDNTDWLKISKMVEKMYILGNKRHDYLGIRENMFNLVNVSAHNINDVYDVLVKAYPKTKVFLVGGYGEENLNVPQAAKEFKKIESGIIVSCKEALLKHLGDKPYMKFKSNIKSNNIKSKVSKSEYTFVWKNLEAGETVEFTPSTLASLMRDYKLNSLLL